jgi:hypothetical protein
MAKLPTQVAGEAALLININEAASDDGLTSKSRSQMPPQAAQAGEESGAECDPVPESTMGMKRRSEVAVIGKRFRSAELPGWNELEAFVNEISPALRSRLAWLVNRSQGIDTNAIRQLLKGKSIAEEWLRFEQESE